MSARLILHIILTLVLFAVGWWLYASMDNVGALDSVGVATYWFAMLVFILSSWLFYWIVHRLRMRFWIIMQILAIVISAVSTSALLYASREYQKQIEEEVIQEQKDEDAFNSDAEHDTARVIESKGNVETLNLSEGEELNGQEAPASDAE